MVPIDELQVGMRVKIVDRWNEYANNNPDGLMNKWLGCEMTIRAIDYELNDARMEEDKAEWLGGWHWNAHCIDHIVTDDITVDVTDLL